jgi:hypothetical protein
MKRSVFAALLSLLAAGAGAEPVKCVDASGKIRYLDESMVGEEKCKPVRDAMNIVAPQKEPAAKSEPREGPRRQRQEEDAARPQADTRLADAEAKLADARSKLAEQEAIRAGDERNYARVQDRLQPYQEALERAQREVEQLRRESR